MRFAFRLRNHFDFSDHAPSSRTRLGDDSNALLLLRFLRRARSSWQLQHSRLLSHAELGEQHNLPVGELKRVVMYMRLKAYPADSGSSICSRGVDPAWLTLLRGLSRLMMSQ